MGEVPGRAGPQSVSCRLVWLGLPHREPVFSMLLPVWASSGAEGLFHKVMAGLLTLKLQGSSVLETNLSGVCFANNFLSDCDSPFIF